MRFVYMIFLAILSMFMQNCGYQLPCNVYEIDSIVVRCSSSDVNDGTFVITDSNDISIVSELLEESLKDYVVFAVNNIIEIYKNGNLVVSIGYTNNIISTETGTYWIKRDINETIDDLTSVVEYGRSHNGK